MAKSQATVSKVVFMTMDNVSFAVPWLTNFTSYYDYMRLHVIIKTGMGGIEGIVKMDRTLL